MLSLPYCKFCSNIISNMTMYLLQRVLEAATNASNAVIAKSVKSAWMDCTGMVIAAQASIYLTL